jgi:hypothetical protein
MTQSAAVSRLSSEFDDFLFAPIDEDANGMVLRVVSVLARANLDPWQEAATLTELPEKYAAARLAALIAALPSLPSPAADSGMLAAHLIALLPRRAVCDVALSDMQSRSTVVRRSWVVACVVLLVLALGVQWGVAHSQAAAKFASGRLAASASVPSVVLPPFGDQ